MDSIPSHTFLALLVLFLQLLHLSAAHVVPLDTTTPSNPQQAVSAELFNSFDELARIVDISYCVGNTGVHKPFECLSHCRELQGFELITTWNTGLFLSDSCGYIALSHSQSSKRIIVAFRGTYSIANTIVDLSTTPQEYVPYDVGGNETIACTNCSVHAGFMTAWQNTRSTILDYVSTARDEYPEYELVLVGHSLGGAVAALAGVEMQLRGWNPTVTTFGEPKIGNQGFVRFLDDVFGLNGGGDREKRKFRRLTHVDDPVPLLPLEEWGYEMHAGEIYISRAGLSPSVGDVVFCDGDRDERCISGAETRSWWGNSRESVRDDVAAEFTGGREVQQNALVSEDLQEDSPEGESASHLHYRLSWSFIPARYRLWELFFAHRDYFLRIGLCVPGGDPFGGR